MKHLKKILFLLSLPISFFSQAQSNFGFEDWYNFSSWEVPINWTTNNQLGSVSVLKSNIVHSGNFSAEVRSEGPSFEGPAPGILKASFSPITHIDTIYYYMEIDSLFDGATVEIIVQGYFGGTLQFNELLNYSTVTSQFDLYKIPLSYPTSMTLDSIEITFVAKSAASALGYNGYAKFKVDDISIEAPLHMNELQLASKKINVYPNPAKDIVYFENNTSTILGIKLMDTKGNFVKDYQPENNMLDISDISSGAYLILFNTTDGQVTTKITIEK